ncbi:hypothetical protein [Nocardia sp. NPDC051833]|uniref:hypothetical protein n=1 Tax=Nocardia sp. NPDC051833 TaxID=3155674 RepID=UPI003444CD15
MKATRILAASLAGCALMLGAASTASADPRIVNWKIVGEYPTKQDCYFAAADYIGQHPDQRDYQCELLPTTRWRLWVPKG